MPANMNNQSFPPGWKDMSKPGRFVRTVSSSYLFNFIFLLNATYSTGL